MSSFAVPKRAHREAESSPMQQSPSTQSERTVARSPFQFTATDMILFHHCLSADDLKGHIPDQLIRLGFEVHCVLHLLLAVSGFHLGRTSAHNGTHQFLQQDLNFHVEAERHLHTAVSEVTATEPHLHQGNSHVLYIASLFIFICSLARGPQPGEYLAFRDDSDTPGLCLFLGVRSILEASNNLGISEGISEVHPRGGREKPPPQEQGPEPIQDLFLSESTGYNADHSSSQFSDPLNKLGILILNTFPPSDPRRLTFCDLFQLLRSRYNFILGGPVPIAGPELWPQIFSWLYLLPNDFTKEMQQKHPVALLLFAYFAVLLNELGTVWVIREWPLHIVQGISRNLGESHRSFILWPLNQLGLLHSPRAKASVFRPR